MNPPKFLDVGFLFFEFSCGISSFVKSVTKQPFTGMAFYYTTSFYNLEKKEIILFFDFFGLQKKNFVHSVGKTIEDFQKNPLLLRLAKRPVNAVYENGVYSEEKSRRREDLFREKFVTADIKSLDEEDLLKDLFGLKNSSERYSPIRTVNRILLDILESEGKTLEKTDPQYFSTQIRESIEDSDLGRLQILGLLGTSFYPHPDNFGISHLLQEKNILGDLIEVPLDKISEIKRQKIFQENSALEKIFMENFLKSFNRLLFENRRFLSIVIQGVNSGIEIEERKTEISENLIDDLICEANNFVFYLQKKFNEGELCLPEFMDNLNKLLQKIQFLGKIKKLSRTISSFEISSEKTILLHSTCNPSVNQERISKMISQILNASETIQRRGVPEIDMDEFSTLLQSFSERRITLPKGRFAGYLNSQNSNTEIREIILTPTTSEEELLRIPLVSRKEILLQLRESPSRNSMSKVIEKLEKLLS